MEDYLPVILELFFGAVGANLAAAIIKEFSLGTMWNSILGIVGGGIGATVLGMIGLEGMEMNAAGAGLDLGTIVGSVAGGGIGGGVLLLLIGLIRKAASK